MCMLREQNRTASFVHRHHRWTIMYCVNCAMKHFANLMNREAICHYIWWHVVDANCHAAGASSACCNVDDGDLHHSQELKTGYQNKVKYKMIIYLTSVVCSIIHSWVWRRRASQCCIWVHCGAPTKSNVAFVSPFSATPEAYTPSKLPPKWRKIEFLDAV